MLRLPKARVDVRALEPYFGRVATARLRTTRAHVVIDLSSDTEEPEYDEASEGSLTALSHLRTELLHGDLRPAYLAWLLGVQSGELEDDAAEPLVPPGLRKLTGVGERAKARKTEQPDDGGSRRRAVLLG
jgi:hypothetical protein